MNPGGWKKVIQYKGKKVIYKVGRFCQRKAKKVGSVRFGNDKGRPGPKFITTRQGPYRVPQNLTTVIILIKAT